MFGNSAYARVTKQMYIDYLIPRLFAEDLAAKKKAKIVFVNSLKIYEALE